VNSIWIFNLSILLTVLMSSASIAEEAAKITVLAPADADVLFDGEPTTQKGKERFYVTPPLDAARKYTYTVTARWRADGKNIERIRKVEVAAGADLLVDFLAADPVVKKPQQLSPKEAAAIAEEAYIYGYSLITSEVTRVQMSNVAKVEALRAPMNQFVNVKRYPPGDYRGVSAPNADTLYSLAWLDVGPEPIVFSHPDMGKRFYLFPMYSLWMPVIESPGSRTTGGDAVTYLITGPQWQGVVPKGRPRATWSSSAAPTPTAPRKTTRSSTPFRRSTAWFRSPRTANPIRSFRPRSTPIPASA
jgi:uncharacterized protein (TIGR03000 family)